jgi:hypothetical protein
MANRHENKTNTLNFVVYVFQILDCFMLCPTSTLFDVDQVCNKNYIGTY